MSDAGTPMAGRRRALIGLTALCASVVMAGAMIMPAADAQADTFLGVDSPAITASNGKTRIVHFGTLGYGARNTLCLDARIASPDSLSTKDSELVTNRSVAYVVNRYLNTGNRYQAAAMSWYVRNKAPDSHLNDATKAMNALKAKDHADYVKIMAQYSTISAAVDRWAGPYTLQPEVSTTDETSGTVDQIGVKSASGAWVDGKKVTVTLSGPATFADGSTTRTGTTERSPLAWTWTSTGDGQVSATVTVSGLKGSSYRVYHPVIKGQQRLAVAGPSATLTVSASQPVAVQPGPPPPTLSPAPSPQPSDSPTPSQSPTPSDGRGYGDVQPAAYAVRRAAAPSMTGALARALNPTTRG